MTANSQSPKPKCKCNTEDREKKVQIHFLLCGDPQCFTSLTHFPSIKLGTVTALTVLFSLMSINSVLLEKGKKETNKQILKNQFIIYQAKLQGCCPARIFPFLPCSLEKISSFKF